MRAAIGRMSPVAGRVPCQVGYDEGQVGPPLAILYFTSLGT